MKLETERGAMLSDIIFIEKELEKTNEEGNFLRSLITEGENEIVNLRAIIE